ncbi:MAG: hypothetical protein LBW85_03530 [Deltaproteobacteria bacterium]|jgi:tetratricopeptide (TPR) repeat protein|nr:hypothetical protein [Deltaproteobacteria bacterium]
MRNLYRKTAALRDLCHETSRNLRITAPQTDLNAFRRLEAKNLADIREAARLFREIMEDNLRLGSPLGCGMLARMAFNLADRMTRHGLQEESDWALKIIERLLAETPPGSGDRETVLMAHGLSVMAQVFVRLLHIDIPAAMERIKLFDRAPYSDMTLRQKAGVGYYLAYGCLTLEKDAAFVEALADSFLPYRERIRENPVDRTAEIFSASARERELAKADPEPGAPADLDFPLVLGIDGQRLLSVHLPHEIPQVGVDENTTEILASIAMLLTVYWGDAGDIDRSLKWFEEITSWGDSGSVKAIQAEAATFMVSYIGERDPDEALHFFRKIFGNFGEKAGPLRYGFTKARARAAVNLMGVMAAHRRGDECLRILGLMDQTPFYRRNPEISSRATFLAVECLASQGRIREAKEVFLLIPDFGPTMEVRVMHGRAAVTVIHYAGIYGNLEDAREIYDYVMSNPERRELWYLRARTACAMVAACERRGDLAGALGVYRSMRSGRRDMAEDLDRAAAALSVIRLMARIGDGQGAQEIFQSLGPWGSDCEEMDLQRAGILVNLIPILGKAGMLRKARDLYAAMPAWGSSPEMDLTRAKAAVNLVGALEEAGEPRKAQAVYDAMGVWGKSPGLCCEKAKAAVTLIGLYGRLGEPRKAQAVFDGLPEEDVSPAYRELKESCLLNLLTALAMARRWTEALQAATGPSARLLSSAKREELLKRLDQLMTRTEAMGGKERRKVLRFLADRLRNH